MNPHQASTSGPHRFSHARAAARVSRARVRSAPLAPQPLDVVVCAAQVLLRLLQRQLQRGGLVLRRRRTPLRLGKPRLRGRPAFGLRPPRRRLPHLLPQLLCQPAQHPNSATPSPQLLSHPPAHLPWWYGKVPTQRQQQMRAPVSPVGLLHALPPVYICIDRHSCAGFLESAGLASASCTEHGLKSSHEAARLKRHEGAPPGLQQLRLGRCPTVQRRL